MARAVLDTNVIISSVISRRGFPRAIVSAWQAGNFELVTSPALIAEVTNSLSYDRVKRRYGLTDETLSVLLSTLQTRSTLIPDPTDVPVICGDPDDDIVLGVCRGAAVDFLVTGDKLLLDLGSHGQHLS